MHTDYTQYYNDSTSTLFEDVHYQGLSEYDWHISRLQLEQFHMGKQTKPSPKKRKIIKRGRSTLHRKKIKP